MAEFLNGIEYWYWLIFGLVLLGLEILVFGAFFLWLGLAALVVGVLALFISSLLWSHQIIIWAVLSVIGAFGWQLYKKKHPSETGPTKMNRRGEQYVGRHFTLTKDIINGVGKLHVDDTRWRIVCDHDLPAGTKVKVTAVDGTSLRVEEFVS